MKKLIVPVGIILAALLTSCSGLSDMLGLKDGAQGIEGPAGPAGQDATSLSLVFLPGSAGLSVASGNGTIVGGGIWGSATTSADGVAWNKTADYVIGSSGGPSRIVFGGGVFVAIAGTEILSSANGVDWTASAIAGPAGSYYSVATDGAGHWVAVGIISTNTAVALSSDNGLTWTSSMPANPSTTVKALAYGNGRFVAVDSGGSAWASDDSGATWVQYTVDSIVTPSLNDVIFAGPSGSAQFVAVGDSGAIYSSSNGSTWTNHSVFSGAALTRVSYGKGAFVAAESYFNFTYYIGIATLYVSRDGLKTWGVESFTTGNFALTDMTYSDVGTGFFVLTFQNIAS